MSEFSAMPLVVDTHLVETMGMSAEEHCAYVLLKALAWRQPEGRLSGNMDELRDFFKRQADMHGRTFNAVVPKMLVTFFRQDADGYWVHDDLEAQRRYLRRRRKKKAENNPKDDRNGSETDLKEDQNEGENMSEPPDKSINDKGLSDLSGGVSVGKLSSNLTQGFKTLDSPLQQPRARDGTGPPPKPGGGARGEIAGSAGEVQAGRALPGFDVLRFLDHRTLQNARKAAGRCDFHALAREYSGLVERGEFDAPETGGAFVNFCKKRESERLKTGRES